MNPARFFAYKGRFCTAPVGAAISRPRVDEDIDPYRVRLKFPLHRRDGGKA